MVVQKRKQATRTPKGHTVQVAHLTREDVEQELARLEAKYEMTSQEFVDRWNRGELDCSVGEYFDWAGLCYSAYDYGRSELEIVDEGVEVLRVEEA
jgi:hypothetical protein